MMQVFSDYVIAAFLSITTALLLPLFVAYISDTSGLHIVPGPLLAKFSNLWIFWVTHRNRWSEAIHLLHRDLGPFVRLSPNHVSISDPKALPIIYGHSTGFTKTGWYDALSSFRIRNIFNTRSRVDHARKRRMEAHVFAPQSIRAIEPIAHTHTAQLLRQWDYMVSRVPSSQGGGPSRGKLGQVPWVVEGQRVWVDCMPSLMLATASGITFWAFDTIGDLAFGSPFGMLISRRDIAKAAKDIEVGMDSIAKVSDGSDKPAVIEEVEIPYIETLSTRAETNVCLAWLTPTWRAMLQKLPAFRSNPASGLKLASLATLAVARRMANPNPRPDMLQKLLEARDDDGKPLCPEELSTETLILIIAGSDTIANTTAATIHYVACNPRVQANLHVELDKVLQHTESDVASYDAVKDLPYLDAVIMEGQRLHSTIGAGLPREVPEGGVTIAGRYFKAGTWLSVPLYHLHRDEAVWGPDASQYRPERWIEASAERKQEMMASFAPFSIGPRYSLSPQMESDPAMIAISGRALGVAWLYSNILATLYRRYDFIPKSYAALEVRDSVSRRPLSNVVGIKIRNV